MRVCPYCGYYNPDSFTRCSDVGYGFLTAVLVSPVAAAVGCVVLINLTFGGPRDGQ
jgi:hypothetical protein